MSFLILEKHFHSEIELELALSQTSPELRGKDVKLSGCEGLFRCDHFLPFDEAQYVHPEEGAGCHVDDSGHRRHHQEVDRLCWQPKTAACLERRDELLLQLSQKIAFALHDAHAWKRTKSCKLGIPL